MLASMRYTAKNNEQHIPTAQVCQLTRVPSTDVEDAEGVVCNFKRVSLIGYSSVTYQQKVTEVLQQPEIGARDSQCAHKDALTHRHDVRNGDVHYCNYLYTQHPRLAFSF